MDGKNQRSISVCLVYFFNFLDNYFANTLKGFTAISKTLLKCDICQETLSERSWRTHLTARKHIQRVQSIAEEERREEADRIRYSAAYDSIPQCLQDIDASVAPSVPPCAFTSSLPSAATDVVMEDTFPSFPPESNSTNDPEAAAEQARQLLEDELAKMQYHSSIEDFESRFDEDAPPFLDNQFENLGMYMFMF